MSASGGSVQLWRRVMRPRDPAEPHRAATVLELFFDLVFVVAVAQAAVGLEHAIVEHHIGSGVVYYFMAFFAIWWAWMNFTWFASAYDVDDVPYRLLTLLQMAGALVMAAGIADAMTEHAFTVMVAGYVLMRVAMIGQWLRAAACDPDRRGTALRYAAGIAVVQCCWVGWLWIPESLQLLGFAVFALMEVLVPPFAERVNMTPWHPHHIAERYGLFTIIVLGECILAATMSVQSARAAGAGDADLYLLAGAGLVIVFALWWLYFDQPGHTMLTTLAKSLKWGYGHLFIFAAVAAVGAGLQVAVAVHRGDAAVGPTTIGYAVAVPVAVYLLGVGVLQIFPRACWQVTVAVLVTIVAVLLAPVLKSSIMVIAGCLVLLVAVIAVLEHRVARTAGEAVLGRGQFGVSVAQARQVGGRTAAGQHAHRAVPGLLPHLQRPARAPHPGQLCAVAGEPARDDLIRLGIRPAAVRAQVVHGTFPSNVKWFRQGLSRGVSRYFPNAMNTRGPAARMHSITLKV